MPDETMFPMYLGDFNPAPATPEELAAVRAQIKKEVSFTAADASGDDMPELRGIFFHVLVTHSGGRFTAQMTSEVGPAEVAYEVARSECMEMAAHHARYLAATEVKGE